ncbi:hypothetical protein QR680_008774 [Steinernema hermaphroditum]|uniref:Ubiquitin-like domain-containing protein n=1 Tax=Steinernema hermaphroditum TaxID=289476 RepID=A0AA39M8P6_9BILA|nr:hypothetical protein QR680_008774 [Steinernema hermaphroditum]
MSAPTSLDASPVKTRSKTKTWHFDVRRRRIRTLPEAEVPQVVRPDLMELNVTSIVAGFQPLQLLLPKTATVRTLKVAVRRQTHIRHFTLLFQGKELRGEDSTLESFGISEGATLSLQDCSCQKENAEKAAMQREAEAKKTRSKMDEIRRKKSLRNPNGPLSPVPKKKTVEKAPQKARPPGAS